MRMEGALKAWNGERGTGIIAPADGSADIPVHIKAFMAPQQALRPGQRLVFEASVNWEGKVRARRIRVLADGAADGGRRYSGWLRPGLLVLGVFVAGFALLQARHVLPPWVAVAYLAASLACYALHRLDWRAAVRGRRRMPQTLPLLLGLAGGWPGILLAQARMPAAAVRRGGQAVLGAAVVLNMLVLAGWVWRSTHG